MRGLKQHWWAIWRLALVAIFAVLVIAGCGYWIATAPKGCHIVYVQTTPVNGNPAMERQDVCDR